MSKNCIISTVKSKIKGNATSFIEKENEIFIPTSKKFSLVQTRVIAQDKVNKINKEYLSEKFGAVVSLNTSYTDGTGINIHPSQLLIDAYEVKEGNKSIEELNPRNLDYFNGDEALFEQEQNDELKPFIDESNKVGDESINERLKKYEESIKIPNNVKSKVLEKIEKETEKVKEKLLSLGLKQEGNKFELITNSYATFRMKLKELENVNAIISTNKTSDFYQIIARLKNVDSTMELKKQGELPFTPIEVKQIIQEQQFLNDVADNVFEELSEEEKQILKKKIENGDYNLNCKI